MRALIVNDVVHEIIMHSLEYPGLPDNMKVIAVPNNVQVGWRYVQGNFVPPTAAPQQPGDATELGSIDTMPETFVNAQLAKQELARSDVTVIRCVEDDIKVPDEWKTYREQLRAIVNLELSPPGTPAVPLPPRPPYPEGT